ncbi:MAG: sulfatase [Deltaproteobacteria bacterium]|nr:sulfatase [Deltaproteobacteria bacterium]
MTSARTSAVVDRPGSRVRAGLARCLVALAIVILAIAEAAPRARRPGDVVLIVVDTLRADHISLYGYPRRTTPHLDVFAREAVTYTHAISPATWTVPAHGSLFTGRWPSFHGAERIASDHNLATPLLGDVPTLAEFLGAVGFRTAAFVANTAYVARVLGFARGFAEFFDRDLNVAGEVADAVRRWLPPDGERVFLFLNILDPHEPYEPPPPFDTRFPGKRAEYGTTMTTLVYGGTAVTPEMRAHFVSQYDGEIAYTDEMLARIIAELKRRGRYDDALIIVTSDHGEILGEHGLAGHGVAPYEELLHVPLVVKLPGGRRRGERVRRRVSTLGVFAMILETAGVPMPPEADARALDEPHAVWAEDITYEGERVRVGYDGPEKLVVTGDGDGRTRVSYDLAKDPAELHPTNASDDHLRATLLAFASVLRPARAAASPVIDPEREAKLRALGYLR